MRCVAPLQDPTRLGPTARPAPHAARGGFSLVELIFAVVILAVGMLGLGGTTAYLTRQATVADLQTERAAAVTAALERLRSLDYDAVSSSIDSVGSYEVRVYVTTGASAKAISVVTTGPGLASDGTGMPILTSAVADTFTYSLLRP